MYQGERVRVVTPPGLMQWSAVEPEMADALPEAPVVVLRWHGSYVIADSFARAFHLTQAIDFSARMIIDIAACEKHLYSPMLPSYAGMNPFPDEGQGVGIGVRSRHDMPQ